MRPDLKLKHLLILSFYFIKRLSEFQVVVFLLV